MVWAQRIVDARPSDHILEIGCGTGTLAALLAESLTTGKVVAIDRSAPGIKKANEKYAALVKAGKLEFIHGHFPATPLPRAFDKIVAFNVSNVWSGEANKLEMIKKYLSPGAPLFLFQQPPAPEGGKSMARMKKQLTHHQFRIIDTQLKEFAPAPAFAIISTPQPMRPL